MAADRDIAKQMVEIAQGPAFAVNMDMIITHINAEGAALAGLGVAEALGKKCHEIFPAERCDKDCMVQRCISSEKMITGEKATLHLPSGEARNVLINAAPITEPDGKIVGGLEVIRDVTAEHRLEEQLKEDQERLEEYHNSTMELAMGLSECFQVLSEVRDGNLDARVSDYTLGSNDEVVANLARTLNDTIAEIDDHMETIRRQQFAIQELSTPILQIWDNVLALPIIGVVDTKRSADIMERLLTEVTEKQSQYVILDITGVEVVDTKTADHFIKVIKAAELLGSTCLLTGIRPAVAQTLVELGIELSSIATLRNLQEGLKECLRMMHEHKGA